MSNQILISSGAKLRDLDDVIIGTDGVLTSLGFNVANGVPKLDENGKILVSQLPNSVMEFKGVWNAATNTPTLANGTGNAGDVWLCNVAGTVDFGAGPITFAVGDYAVYTGTVWARSSGATGTVTSVGLSRDGDALSVTGSPITTSGTINLGFSGNNTQYINGAGNLTTFPTIITSIGLTMPAAFNVSNSPLTSNGTIGVTAAGYPSQYIRGDGTLADFPTSGGGGSSVSYYLNGGTSQGTIGGTTYYEMSKTANTGTGVDFSKSGDGLITSFLTDAGDPALLQIPAGNWNLEIYASMSSNGGIPEIYAELYKYDGTTFTLISTSSNEILYDGVNLNLYTFAMAVPETVLTVTDRLAIKLYAANSGGKTTTIHTQDSHLCQIITTFTTGLTALNGLTAQVQYFGTGTSGSDFNIVSSVDTHTFNLPTASATKRGALSSADWSTFNGKQNALTLTTTGSSGASTLISDTLNVPTYTLAGLGGQPLATNLTSLSGLTYASTSFVKMTAAGTFALDTNTYALASALGNYLPLAGGTLTGPVIFNSTTSHLGTASFGTGGPTAIDGTDGRIITNKFRLYNTTPATIYSDFTTAATTNRSIVVPDASGTLALTSDLHSPVTIGTANGLSLSGQVLSLALSSTSATGALSSTDWNTFNNKASTAALANYLPLTGGILTGALEGTTALFRGPFTLNTTAFAVNWVGVAGFTATLTSTTGQPYATYVFNNGYVGIGASNPANRLQLGSVGTTGFGGNDLAIGNGTNAFGIYQDNTATNFYATKPYSFISSNFLIGTAVDSGFKLDVVGTGRFQNTLTGTNAIFSDRVNADSFNIPSSGGSISTSWTLLRDQYSTGDFGIYASTNLRLWIAPSGNTIIGGGSTDAGYKLDVIGTGRFSNSATASKFVTTSNLGLSVNGWGTLSQTLSGQMTILGHNVLASSSVNNQVDVINGGWLSSMIKQYYDQGITFHTSPTNYAAGAVYPMDTTERVRITNAGYVGIGTTNPTQPLVVNRTGGSNYLAVVGDNNAAYDIAAQYTNGTNSVYCGLMRGSTALTGAFTIYTDAPRLNVLSTGQVLIGSTTSVSGGGALQVQGNVNINGVFQINGTTIGGGGGSGVTGSGTTNYITKWTGSTSLGNSIMYEGTNGIGINTTSPTYALDVYGSFGFRNTGYIFDSILYSYNSAQNTYFGFGNNATGGRLFMSNGTTPIQIQAGGGNVLIGTTTDAGGNYKLQVNGSITMAYASFFNFRGATIGGDILVDNSGSTLRVGGSVTASGGFFDTSDRRLKTLVEDNYLLSSIANVKARLYIKDGRKELGYYAQDLESILPSAVKEGADGFLSLSYAQVHTAKIAVIEDEITILKNRVRELEKQLNLN